MPVWLRMLAVIAAGLVIGCAGGLITVIIIYVLVVGLEPPSVHSLRVMTIGASGMAIAGLLQGIAVVARHLRHASPADSSTDLTDSNLARSEGQSNSSSSPARPGKQ